MTNIPNPGRDVIVVLADGTRYRADQLVPDLPAPGSTGHAPSGPHGAYGTPGAGGTAPPHGNAPPRSPSGRTPAEVLADLRDKLSKVQSSKSKTLAAKILSGQSFAPVGARDTELQRAASIVGFLEPNEDPQVLVLVMDDSIRHWQVEDAGTYSHESNLNWAAEKIKRAQDKKRSELAQLGSIKAGLCAAARLAPRGPDLPPPPDDPTADYTPEELEAFAAQQGCTVNDFRERWIIQKGSGFWVYVNGQYQLPVTESELQTCIHRDLAPADGVKGGISLWTLDSKGNRRRKTPREILNDYATVARKFEASLHAQTSYYIADDQRFVEAVSPVRPIEPVFHPEIDAWLRALGGAQADKVLDWVASATRLDRQCCALFLFGAAGTGKTMLAHGLARLWTTGGPTELKRVLGDWSADLARCPLVLADEQIPDMGRGRTSADLRELVGSSSHVLTRKYLANVDLVGAVRLVLAANNFSMLALNEILGVEDIEAVAGRFLFVKVNETARHYLESVTTRGWVDGDLIAQHALWLRDNRPVNSGRRFLVEGQQNSWTRLLAVQGAVPGMVAEWLARCLADKAQKSGPRQRGSVLIAQGQYYVGSQALLDFWELYVKNQRQPHSQAIFSALGNLARRKVRYANTRYWEIDTDTLIAWADEHLIGSEEELRAALAVPSAIPPGGGSEPVEDSEGMGGTETVATITTRAKSVNGTDSSGSKHVSEATEIPGPLASAGVTSAQVGALARRLAARRPNP